MGLRAYQATAASHEWQKAGLPFFFLPIGGIKEAYRSIVRVYKTSRHHLLLPLRKLDHCKAALEGFSSEDVLSIILFRWFRWTYGAIHACIRTPIASTTGSGLDRSAVCHSPSVYEAEAEAEAGTQFWVFPRAPHPAASREPPTWEWIYIPPRRTQ